MVTCGVLWSALTYNLWADHSGEVCHCRALFSASLPVDGLAVLGIYISRERIYISKLEKGWVCRSPPVSAVVIVEVSFPDWCNEMTGR